ncbi:MAG: DUF1501 domain-containing protein, partial [Pirellula sp.]
MPFFDRRRFLHAATAGVSGLALKLMDAKSVEGSDFPFNASNPLQTRRPMLPATVDRMIFLFQYGSPSQVDTFDYKPELQRRNGQLLPDSYLRNPKIQN